MADEIVVRGEESSAVPFGVPPLAVIDDVVVVKVFEVVVLIVPATTDVGELAAEAPLAAVAAAASAAPLPLAVVGVVEPAFTLAVGGGHRAAEDS